MAILSLWGNSAAVRISSFALKEANFSVGDAVRVVAEPGRLIVEAAPPTYDLDAMVASITPQNCHALADYGDAVGAERVEW